MVLNGYNSKCLRAGDPEPAPLPEGHARVYGMRFCPYAEKVIIYLTKKGIPVEVVNIHLKEKPDWYLKKHPEGKVPAFEVNGQVTIESSLIPEYLDDIYPESSILPEDPYVRYQQKLLTEKLSSFLPTGFYGLFAGAVKDAALKEKLKDFEGSKEKFQAAEEALKKAEDLLTDEFYAGSKPGYPDYMVFPFFERYWIITNLGHSPFTVKGFPGANYPKLAKYFKLMQEETKDARSPLDVHLKFCQSFFAGTPNYDEGL